MTDVLSCDRCRATLGEKGYRATHKDGRELLLCDTHERDHRDALEKQKWKTERLNQPDPVAGPKGFVRCSGCAEIAGARSVKASPDSVEVKVVYCKDCDSRTCGFVGCSSKALRDRDTHCPRGHVLMPRDTP